MQVFDQESFILGFKIQDPYPTILLWFCDKMKMSCCLVIDPIAFLTSSSQTVFYEFVNLFPYGDTKGEGTLEKGWEGW